MKKIIESIEIDGQVYLEYGYHEDDEILIELELIREED